VVAIYDTIKSLTAGDVSVFWSWTQIFMFCSERNSLKPESTIVDNLIIQSSQDGDYFANLASLLRLMTEDFRSAQLTPAIFERNPERAFLVSNSSGLKTIFGNDDAYFEAIEALKRFGDYFLAVRNIWTGIQASKIKPKWQRFKLYQIIPTEIETPVLEMDRFKVVGSIWLRGKPGESLPLSQSNDK
jgi:hypothetical protein